jgi:hypothetical protein
MLSTKAKGFKIKLLVGANMAKSTRTAPLRYKLSDPVSLSYPMEQDHSRPDETDGISRFV